MVCVTDFESLVSVLPSLEKFVKDQQLKKLSLVKNCFPDRDSEFFLCYEILDNNNYDLAKIVNEAEHLAVNFEKLWGVSPDNRMLLGQNRVMLEGPIFAEHLNKNEIILIHMENGNYITTSKKQIIEYAKRLFNLTVEPPQLNIPLPDKTITKRKGSENVKLEADKKIKSVTAPYFYNTRSADNRIAINKQIDNLTLEECRTHLKFLVQKFNVRDLNEVSSGIKIEAKKS